jgi:drug/metabolite transporter (DMT)-like permease
MERRHFRLALKISVRHFSSKTMQTTPASILMFIIAAFLGALGQFLYKSGADRAGGSLASYLLNTRLLGGVICYVAVMGLFVAAFKRGGSLTVLYPIYATTFIWAAVIALFVYGTPIRPVNIGGMALLIAGMYFMGRQ